MVEAAAARITLYRNYGQTVAHAVADTLIGGQQSLVDTCLGLLGLLRKGGNLIRRLGLDALQFRFLVVEIYRAVGYDGLCILQLGLLLLDARSVLLKTLLGQFDLQLLIFDLLGYGIELAVVAHVVLLCLVVVYLDLGLIDLAAALLGQRIELFNLAIDVVDAGLQSLDLILEILYFQRQLSLHLVNLVDLRIDLLQLVESHDLLLHRIVDIGCFLLCHIV